MLWSLVGKTEPQSSEIKYLTYFQQSLYGQNKNLFSRISIVLRKKEFA